MYADHINLLQITIMMSLVAMFEVSECLAVHIEMLFLSLVSTLMVLHNSSVYHTNLSDLNSSSSCKINFGSTSVPVTNWLKTRVLFSLRCPHVPQVVTLDVLILLSTATEGTVWLSYNSPWTSFTFYNPDTLKKDDCVSWPQLPRGLL